MRNVASDADLEPLYTAAKFAAAREDRRTTHPLLRDARGLSLPGSDAAELLMISRESLRSSDPASASRELRAPAAHTADRAAHRYGGDSTEAARGRLLLTDGVRAFVTDPPKRR